MRTERQEQQALHEWCKLKKLFSFAVPNGGSRHTLEAVNLKKEGVVAGVSDYVVMLPDKILFIEMKRSQKKLKSGKMSVSHTNTSNSQKAFIDRANSYGYAAAKVCYGFTQARDFILDNMKKR